MGRKINDIAGRRFGRLVVTEFVCVEKGKARWRCICDCGIERVVLSGDLVTGHTTSCGCRSRELAVARMWTGHGKIGSTYWNHLRRGAEKRGYSFEITIEYAWGLVEAQNGLCAVSAEKLIFTPGRAGNASLDRIDNKKGYIEGNVRWTTKTANLMKNSLTDDVFIHNCRLIAKVADAKRAAEFQSLGSSSFNTIMARNEHVDQTASLHSIGCDPGLGTVRVGGPTA